MGMNNFGYSISLNAHCLWVDCNFLSIHYRLITSDFAAAAVLISFGAVLGKVSRIQLMIIGLFEIVFYALNEKILSHKLHITDVGGSMVIHAFGAYFGLALAKIIHNDDIGEENEKEGSTYNSDLFAMIGKHFLKVGFDITISDGATAETWLYHGFLRPQDCCSPKVEPT